MNEWVKVEDKNPPPGEAVLACWSNEPGYRFNGSMEVAIYDKKYGWGHVELDDGAFPLPPTHWLPLPTDSAT